MEEDMKQKGFSAAILLLIITVVGVGGYLIYQNQNKSAIQQTTQPLPTPDETINWEVYTNTKYGYSLKYPPSLYIDSEKEYGPGFRLTKNKDVQDPTERVKQPEFGVIVQKNSDLEKQIADTKSMSPEANFKQVEVNGIEGYRLENIIEGNPLGTISTFLGKDNNVFAIMIFTSTADPELLGIYDNMVSTFKFTQ